LLKVIHMYIQPKIIKKLKVCLKNTNSHINWCDSADVSVNYSGCGACYITCSATCKGGCHACQNECRGTCSNSCIGGTASYLNKKA